MHMSLVTRNAIALFDVLGFRERIKTTPPENFGRLLDELHRVSSTSNPSETHVGAVLYSDSIVLYGKSSELAMNVFMVTTAASNLLNLAARHGFPLRGALSIGPMYIDAPRSYAIGPALVDAYDLEQRQAWMGAVVNPACEAEFMSAIPAWTEPGILVRYPAPMKDGSRQECLCVGWTFRLPNRGSIDVAFKGSEERQDAFLKHQNTLAFFDSQEPVWQRFQKNLNRIRVRREAHRGAFERARKAKLKKEILLWCAADRQGQVAIFCPTSGGPIPALLSRHTVLYENVDEAIAFIYFDAIDEQDETEPTLDSYTALGFFVYVWERQSRRYVRKSVPEDPISIGKLPTSSEIADVATRLGGFNLDFSSQTSIDFQVHFDKDT